MGWSNELTPGHDGAILGLKACTDPRSRTDGYRELSADDDESDDIGPLAIVQVGCSCGWRSPRMEGAISATWLSGSVQASEWFLAECKAIWLTHAIEAAVKTDQDQAMSSR